MRTSAFMAREDITQLPASLSGLRERLSILAATPGLKTGAESVAPGALLPFAIPRLDALLQGGLKRAALHEVRSAESRDAAAMTGFAVALLSRLSAKSRRPLLWIVEQTAAAESGFLYGGGLRNFGIDPTRLIVVRVTRAIDALWVFEEGLRSAGLAAVVAEIHGNPRQIDLTASRRLALRAAEHRVTGLLLRQSAQPLPSAASTRWLVAPLPAAADAIDPEGIGAPIWRLTLERNRQGATGAIDVEWDHDRHCFIAAEAAHSRPLVPLSRHRPPAPADAGKIVALACLPREDLPRERRRLRLQARG
ncbi:MAG TPA: DNA repair protein [Xanthobacteraceae bacterium]|nr:DNA repair protein [Xanthobacteraceae bacterium]